MNLLARAQSLLRFCQPMPEQNPDRFLKHVRGVIHVGANTGQERELYSTHGLNVFWVEAIPDVFLQLQSNISPYANQRAVQALVTDVDDKEYEFHIASNDGASSSILNFKYHKDIWPHVAYTSSLLLKSTTLTSLLRKERIDIAQYQALVLDTQGSEMLILQGGLTILKHFAFIKVELPDFEAYEECCREPDVTTFLKEQGYQEYSRHSIVTRSKKFNYFDIIYKRLD